MPRFRRSFRRARGRRPRTRWLALEEILGTLGTATGTNFYELTWNDADGNVPLNNFYGGTILRIILCVAWTPVIDPTATFQLHRALIHQNVFTDQGDAPEVVLWNPANPHGSVMDYKCALWHGQHAAATDGAYAFESANDHWPVTMFDTNVKRKLEENTRIFYGQTWNYQTLASFSFNVTGRLLVQLP